VPKGSWPQSGLGVFLNGLVDGWVRGGRPGIFVEERRLVFVRGVCDALEMRTADADACACAVMWLRTLVGPISCRSGPELFGKTPAWVKNALARPDDIKLKEETSALEHRVLLAAWRASCASATAASPS